MTGFLSRLGRNQMCIRDRIGTLRGAVGDEAAGEVPLVCGASVPRDLAEPRRGLLRRLLSWLEER